MTDKITIRKLDETDIPVILPYIQIMYKEHDLKESQLFKESSFSNLQIENYLLKSLKAKKSTFLVAEMGLELVGIIKCQIKKPPHFYKEKFIGYTDDLVVLDKYKRRGVATKLKTAAEE